MINCPLILNDNENSDVQFNNSMLAKKTSFKAIHAGIIISIVDIRNLLLYKRSLFIWQHTEVCFASFLSGGFTTMAVINPQERKLAKRTSVEWGGKFANQAEWKKCEFIWAYLFMKFTQNNHPTRLFGT